MFKNLSRKVKIVSAILAFTATAITLTSCYYGHPSLSGSNNINSAAAAATPTNGETYTLVNRNSGLVLEVVNASVDDGANVQQWEDNGHNCQRWRLESTSSGYYHVVNVHSGKYLEVQNASTDAGANVAQYGDTGHACQEWSFQSAGDGYYILVNRNSGQAADVWEWSTEWGANIAQWTNHGGANQQWMFLLDGESGGESSGEPDGYAGYAGTTGGGNASPITVSSASEFKSAVNNSNSAVIIVNGRFDLGGDVTIGSNKTIKGANSSSGLYGGTVKVQGTNYIFQNLTFGPSEDDVMEVSGATNVFITKSTFHDSTDELCSIVRQADFVTVSWCKFYFDNPDSHAYAHLIGNGDDVTADRGKLHVTMHHNWYTNGVQGRMPRVRFGYVHLYNNYYNSNNTDYCIGIGVECHIRLENTHFDNVEDPWADYGGTDNGEIGWSNVKFEGTSQPSFMSNSFPVFSPPYSFALDPVDSVESIVRAGAGNVFN